MEAGAKRKRLYQNPAELSLPSLVPLLCRSASAACRANGAAREGCRSAHQRCAAQSCRASRLWEYQRWAPRRLPGTVPTKMDRLNSGWSRSGPFPGSKSLDYLL
ncbi:hypothetical protein GQ53DRAFT_342213 [Thozetella sp. PMI_491]|nr:hypothetical protein GQ53DRAFT_342213 [Thozetella sp. PMI_491]